MPGQFTPAQMPATRVDHSVRPERPAYSTTTGVPTRLELDRIRSAKESLDWGPFCFVCGRPTDHVGDHDDLHDVGLVEYEVDADGWLTGTVRKAATWSDAAARAVRGEGAE